MNKTKSAIDSLTIRGAVIVLVSFTVSKLQLDISNQEVVDVVTALGILVGAAITIYGRYRADTKIK